MIGIEGREHRYAASEEKALEKLESIIGDREYVYLQTEVDEYENNSRELFSTHPQDTDKEGMYKRYVWLEVPDNDKNYDEVRTKMLNAVLLDQGLATPNSDALKGYNDHLLDLDQVYRDRGLADSGMGGM